MQKQAPLDLQLEGNAPCKAAMVIMLYHGVCKCRGCGAFYRISKPAWPICTCAHCRHCRISSPPTSKPFRSCRAARQQGVLLGACQVGCQDKAAHDRALLIQMAAGHAGVSGVFSQLRETALEQAFLLRAICAAAQPHTQVE